MKRFIYATLLSLATTVFAGNPIPNPGFEAGEKDWGIGDNVSHVTSEAARTGKNGLRVKIDNPQPRGSSAMTARLPVEAGKDIELTFWLRAEKRLGGLYLYFYDKDGKTVKNGNKHTGGMPHLAVPATGTEWKQCSLKATVPEGAVSVAAWIHAYSSNTGTADFDDFAFSGLPADAKPLNHPTTQRPGQRKPVNKPLPDHPPVIILKLDDVTARGAKGGQGVSSRWQKLVDIVEKEGIKANLGIIGSALDGNNQKLFDWIKEQNKKDCIEFWNHGQTHKELPKQNGKRRCEFSVSVEEQKATLKKTQSLAKEKLGFELKGFGAPFNVVNMDTDVALADFPEIEVWFFAPGRAKASKTVKLKRVVNLEHPTMNPSSAGLIRDYEYKGKFEPYLVLQGHPNGWNDKRFDEFAKAIAYLKSKGCKFVTMSEYAASQKK